MRLSRTSLFALLLVAGVLATLPGVDEWIESLVPGVSCSEDCATDGPDSDCGSSCDECTCCARTMSAVFLPCNEPGSPGRLETAVPAISARAPLAFSNGVYHPPRA